MGDLLEEAGLPPVLRMSGFNEMRSYDPPFFSNGMSSNSHAKVAGAPEKGTTGSAGKKKETDIFSEDKGKW